MNKILLMIGFFVFACGGSALVHANVASSVQPKVTEVSVLKADTVVPGDTAKAPTPAPADSKKQVPSSTK